MQAAAVQAAVEDGLVSSSSSNVRVRVRVRMLASTDASK